MLRECGCGTIEVRCPRCSDGGALEYLNTGDLHICLDCNHTFNADEGGSKPFTCGECLAKLLTPETAGVARAANVIEMATLRSPASDTQGKGAV